jgi:hypothetical protein
MPASQEHITDKTPMGANLVSGGATFRVFAPSARAVYINGIFDGVNFFRKWAEDSETVAIGAYQGIRFGSLKLREDGAIERIEIKLPSGYVPTQVSQVQTQLKKAAVHLAQLLSAIQYE